MKVIIAIDLFKGCLSSKEANEAAAEGIRAMAKGSISTSSGVIKGFVPNRNPLEHLCSAHLVGVFTYQVQFTPHFLDPSSSILGNSLA